MFIDNTPRKGKQVLGAGEDYVVIDGIESPILQDGPGKYYAHCEGQTLGPYINRDISLSCLCLDKFPTIKVSQVFNVNGWLSPLLNGSKVTRCEASEFWTEDQDIAEPKQKFDPNWYARFRALQRKIEELHVLNQSAPGRTVSIEILRKIYNEAALLEGDIAVIMDYILTEFNKK